MISDIDGRWDLVGGCPTPGSPQDIQDLGASMHARAQQSQDLQDRLREFSAAVADAGWRGRIAEAFLVGLSGLGPVLRDQDERAAAVGLRLDAWSQALGQAKGRALELLRNAEDCQRRSREAEIAPDKAEQAETDLSAIRAQVHQLAEHHQESARLIAGFVGQQTFLATPPIEGLLAATIHAVAPGHLQRPEPDSDGLPQIRSVLEVIEGSWMGQAESIARRLVRDEGVPDLVLGGVLSPEVSSPWLGWQELAEVAIGDLPLADDEDIDQVHARMDGTTILVQFSLPTVDASGPAVGVSLMAPSTWQRIRRQGLLHLASPSAAHGAVPSSTRDRPSGVSAGLAIRVRRLESTAAGTATTPDILRAAMLLGDGMTSEVLRPLDRPVEVLMRGGFGVRRAYLGRVGDGPLQPDDRVVLIDRFLFTRDTMLVSVDFHTPAVGLREVLRPLFADVATSLEVTIDG